MIRATHVNTPANPTFVSNDLPSIPSFRLFGHDGPIRAVQFSADGTYCITGGNDRTVRLFNPLRLDPAYSSNSPIMNNKREKYLNELPHALPIQTYTDGYTYPISAIDLDDTSTTLVAGSDKTLVVTDVITRKLKRRFQGHSGRINSVSCSSGGSTFLSASYDGTVRIFDGRSFNSEPIQILSDAKDSVSCVKVFQKEEGFSGISTAEIITSSVDGKLRTYDLRKGLMKVDDFGKDTVLTYLSQTNDSLCNAVATLGDSVHIVEKSSGALLKTLRGGHHSGRYAIECAFTANDKYVVSGSENGDAVFYDVVSGKVVQTLKGHSRATCTVAVHPNENKSSCVITGSYDGNALVWTNGLLDA